MPAAYTGGAAVTAISMTAMDTAVSWSTDPCDNSSYLVYDVHVMNDKMIIIKQSR